MIRVAVLGVVGVLLAQQLKTLKSELAIYLCLGVSLLIFLNLTGQLTLIRDTLLAIQTSLPLNVGYLQTLMKIIGITYIAEFASDLCKDAGYQTIAGQIQMFGKLMVLAVSMPILSALLDTIQSFL
ncbi:MAG: stage III sporulation protein AD [Lachnospiraceae bacterium]|nr:stage III sporulation protein AD [Lachnospiraceae bacterium]